MAPAENGRKRKYRETDKRIAGEQSLMQGQIKEQLKIGGLFSLQIRSGTCHRK
jgi:hypothetical protein